MPVYRHKNRKETGSSYYYEFQLQGKRKRKSGFSSYMEAAKAEFAEREKIRKKVQNDE